MISLRKVVGILFAMTLAAFALPGIAGPAKYFAATVLPVQVPLGVQTTLTASFANASPPQSNSTINSGILTLPAGSGLTIDSITSSSGNVTLSPNVALPYSGPGPVQIKFYNITGVKPSDPPFTLTVKVTAPLTTACHAVTWGVQAYAGNSWTGDPFTNVPPSSLLSNVGCIFTGTANCGAPIQTGDPAGTGMRGLFNKDGTCNPVAVNYTFINNGLIDGSAVVKWDLEPGAAFSFTVFGNPVDVDPSTGWPASNSIRPLVGWDFATPTSDVPIYKAFAVACVGNTLPAPYGSLGTSLPALPTGAGTIVSNVTVTTAVNVTLPAAPFPIQIGSAASSERLKVTSTSASSGTVTMTLVRGDGLSSGTPVPAHAAGVIVASNPLPIDPNPLLPNGDPNPYVGQQDQMCVAARGWTSFGFNPLNGKQRVRWWAYIFDVGDGWITPNE